MPEVSMAGALLAKYRRQDRRLTQEDVTNVASFERSYLSLLERGKRDILNAEVRKLIRVIRALGLTAEQEQDLEAALVADDICTILREEGVGEVRNVLAAPLRSRECLLLRHALSLHPAVSYLPHPILSTKERLRAIRKLEEVLLLTEGSPLRADVTARNQAVYHLSRARADATAGLLNELHAVEQDPIVRRSVAIGMALLGNRRVLHAYLERLREDVRERARNLGYMGWYSGERRISYKEAYSTSGEWTGERTLDWLLNELEMQPDLWHLNLLSVRTLLEDRGEGMLDSLGMRTGRLVNVIGRLEYAGMVETAGAKSDMAWLKKLVGRQAS